MIINILNICNNVLKSLKMLDNNINVQNYIESYITKNIIITKPNAENSDNRYNIPSCR